MSSVISAEIRKRTSSATVKQGEYTDEWVVRTGGGVTAPQVEEYMRTKNVYPGYLLSSTVGCSSVECAMASLDGQLWVCTARYVSLKHEIEGGGVSTTPLDEPWQVRFSKTTLNQVVERAYATWVDGGTIPTPSATPDVKILNSVADPFDPPLTQDITLPVIELSKNVTVAAYEAYFSTPYDDSINTADITIVGRAIPKWCGKISVTGEKAYYNKPDTGKLVAYMRAHFTVTINHLTWARFVLNAGFRGKNEAGVVVRATELGYADRNADTPLRLDSGGYFLDPSQPPESSHWLAFLTLSQTSWTGLSLPSSL